MSYESPCTTLDAIDSNVPVAEMDVPDDEEMECEKSMSCPLKPVDLSVVHPTDEMDLESFMSSFQDPRPHFPSDNMDLEPMPLRALSETICLNSDDSVDDRKGSSVDVMAQLPPMRPLTQRNRIVFPESFGRMTSLVEDNGSIVDEDGVDLSSSQPVNTIADVISSVLSTTSNMQSLIEGKKKLTSVMHHSSMWRSVSLH